MEQAYQKPLLFILNEPERYHGLFIEIFDEDFNVTFVPALTPQLKRQLKKLAQQDEIGGVVYGLDASGITAQQNAWFAARQIFRMGIPVVCCTEQEYDEKRWKRLKGRFPELNTEMSYFALAKEDNLSAVKSALHQQIAQKEQRERRRKKLWYRLGCFIKDQFPI
jgi:hypothetical protein